MCHGGFRRRSGNLMEDERLTTQQKNDSFAMHSAWHRDVSSVFLARD